MPKYPKPYKFTPKNKEKYKGNPNTIIVRSSWEKEVMIWLDTHSKVKSWVSEELVIPYISPVDNRRHRYFPDFLASIEENGIDVTYLIEVKPRAQTLAPKMKKRLGKPTKRYVTEVTTYLVNDAKFAAATAYCEKMGWRFKIITEENLKNVR